MLHVSLFFTRQTDGKLYVRQTVFSKRRVIFWVEKPKSKKSKIDTDPAERVGGEWDAKELFKNTKLNQTKVSILQPLDTILLYSLTLLNSQMHGAHSPTVCQLPDNTERHEGGGEKTCSLLCAQPQKNRLFEDKGCFRSWFRFMSLHMTYCCTMHWHITISW